MSDLIDRQAAIDCMMRLQREDEEAYGASIPEGFDGDRAAEALMQLPSAQPEIIRCRDCKHQVKEWREDKRFKDNGYWVHGCEVISDVCGYWALFGHNDQFCSEAERRKDG